MRSPRLMKIDANDHNFPSSVHEVLSNDDLVMDILLRLPILELHLFKRVCKQWLSLIKSPSFTSTTLTRIPPPSGLFIRRWSLTSKTYEYDFVSFDPTITAKRSLESLALCLSGVKHSCNGLILCLRGPDMYVCNPSISSMLMMLPPKHDLYHVRNSYERINFAFDPTKSPACYKVVHCGLIDDDDNDADEELQCFIKIQTYSSETGVWSVSDDTFPGDLFDDFSNGVYWNGAIHWLCFNYLIKLDIVDHPVLTKIQPTLPRTISGDRHCDRKLFKSSHDSLLLLCKEYVRSRNFIIYEMNNGYFVWSVKYSVNLDDMMTPYPTWRMPTNWSCRDMLSIVLGERDEDSFMVIEHSGNILQYKFGLQTVNWLFYCGKPVIRKCLIRKSLCFDYIASFAHV